MYESQFSKMYPFDWFCDHISHIIDNTINTVQLDLNLENHMYYCFELSYCHFVQT